MVFRDLDFALDAGEALVLVGPNGSGKSSLLRIVAGLLRPMVGGLFWDGEPTSEDPEAQRARIHYVGHHDAVKPVLSVRENLAFWADLREGDGAARIEHALDAFGIAHLTDVPGRFLSAGQKRRVNLARILAAEAPVWLLDEPTTALDRQAIKDLEATMAEHRRAGGLVILSTHSDVALDGHRVMNLADYAVAHDPAATMELAL